MKSFISVLAMLLFIPALTGAFNEPDQACYRCHGMPTLSMKDLSSGKIRNLSILPKDASNSVHKFLYCTDCHSEDFAEFPHPKALYSENISCLDCHEDDPDTNFIQFNKVYEAFGKSVHVQKLGDSFSCFDCHEMHSFQLHARVSKEVQDAVLYDNHTCLNCHGNEDKFNSMTDKVFPGLEATHYFLPHQQLHWKNVRCLDCHSDPEQPGVSHLILPKEKAVKNCVECHSANSRLAQTLYKFQSTIDRSEQGFVNAVILNNSYVIGATRNYYLNMLSFVIFGLMLFVLGMHGYFYAGAIRRRTSSHSHPAGKEYFYPLWLRLWHWINALLFIALIISGLTLQYARVEGDPLIGFGTAITIHNVSGITLTLNYLLFFIGNIITGNYKQYVPIIKGIFERLFLQAKFYAMGIFKNEPHPFETTIKKKFNPLQQITYLNIMYILLPVIIISGWGLLFPETILDEFLGANGLFLTALVHTVTGFFLSLFMFGHIYLATTGHTVTSNFKAMLNGWHEVHHD